MAKYANQNVYIINKTPCKENFLQINNEEWMEAAKLCDRSFNAFKLYLYLAANKIGHEKNLSKQDIEDKLGFKKTSYYDSLEKLEELGYILNVGKHKYEFYSVPIKKNENSVEAENSALEEKVKEEKNSVPKENSVGEENVPLTFNF